MCHDRSQSVSYVQNDLNVDTQIIQTPLQALISLARPNPLAFDRTQISCKTLAPKSRLRGQMKSLYAGYVEQHLGEEK